MDGGFRMRLRKGEGVSKKGPLVAKHSFAPSSSNGSSGTTAQVVAAATAPVSSSHSKEIRSPIGQGPPGPLGSHRRRPHSPDPRVGARRAPLRESPKSSPKASPKTSPVRHAHRERSSSPSNSRRVSNRNHMTGGGGHSMRGNSSRTLTSPPSPQNKRITPPTSPRIRRPLSPARKIETSFLCNKPGIGPSASPKVRPAPLKCLPSAAIRPPSPNTNAGMPGVIQPTKQLHSPSTSRPASPGNRRPPSPRGTSPRGTSPRGTSPRGRGASPGSKAPPISEEVLKARVQKALKARLYLLHQPGPNSFSVGGDSPSHKYKVIIGPQTCSCGHGPYCIHVLFVMVRVLQLSESDPLLVAGSLKDYEVEQLLRGWEERRKKAIRARERRLHGDSRNKFLGGGVNKGAKSSPGTPTCPSIPSESHASGDDSLCPICLMMMVEGESLVACEEGCRNLLHDHCMSVWAADRHTLGQPLLCPLCRAPWPYKNQPRAAHHHPKIRANRNSASGSYSPTSHPANLNQMSASFSGIGTNSRGCPSGASQYMSRSLSAYPYSTRNHSDSAYSSLNMTGTPEPFGVSGYPMTVRGELSAAYINGGSEEMVPLPRSDPIPEEHEATAAGWVQVFGKELIACLFSRDWATRETGLRRLSHEVVKVLHLDRLVTSEHMQQNVIHCCANILAQVAIDPVYKVYLSCLRCVCILLSNLYPVEREEIVELQELLSPLLHTLLLKCADGNRRTSQISIDFIVEMCRGQRGELALGSQSGGATSSPGLGGISYVLSCILEDSPPAETPWQWLLGRLSVLERLLDEFPHEFQLQIVELNPSDSGYKLQHYDRLMTVVEFAFKALGSNHATVAKLGRKIYISGARMAAAEPAVFNQVCDMLSKLDISLQMRLKRRIRPMKGSHGDRRGSFVRFGEMLPLPSKDLVNGPRLVRSVSHSPSRMLSALRSSSPSFFSRPSTKLEDQPEKLQRLTKSPPRPNHLPLNSFEVSFKQKQAKLRMYQKAKRESPMVAQHALISPRQKPSNVWSTKSSSKNLLKGGLSQSYGDSLDMSPQTPITSIVPRYLLKEALAAPSTPSAPNCTPVKETIDRISNNEVEDREEPPLPVIPSLDLVPKYLDENVDSNQNNVEARSYEEGRDWRRGPLLGTGAFSSCYQAYDVQTGTLMAVKQVTISRNSEEEQERVEAAIEEEVLMMSKLRHPHIVRLIGSTRVNSSFSIFSEWMAGSSVAALLDKYGSFSENVIIKYTKQILGGLSYLHDNMILHRDLKGANLLIDGSGHWLRIADFGTAARLASKSTVTGEFQGQLLGTIAFMAPEVLRGDDYGRACDVWSVGCCIIEMFTTKPPWGADNVSNQYKLMFRIATSNGPPHVPECLSSATRELALQCLQISSEKRPQAKELLRHKVFNTKPP